MNDIVVAKEKNLVARVDLGNLVKSKAALFNDIGNADSIRNHLGVPITVIGHLLDKTSVVNKDTGELVSDVDILYLFSKERVYLSVSSTLVKRYIQLVSIFGNPSDWDGGVTLVFNRDVSDRNKVFYTVNIAD